MADDAGQKKTERLHMLISPDELEAIDEWRFENRIGTRAEAVRRLVQIGLRIGIFAEMHGKTAFELSKWAYSEDSRFEATEDGVLVPIDKFNALRHLIVSLTVQLGRSEHFAKSPHFERLLEKEREQIQWTLDTLRQAESKSEDES